MNTTVLDRLIMELRVWPEVEFIAGHEGWLWQYQTKGGFSAGPLNPAIPAPSSDPTGRVTKEEWLRAKEAAAKAPTNVVSWDGEGLPPVGATIEFTHSNFIKSYHENPRKPVWVKATVKYVSHSNFIYIDDEGIERARTDIELIRYRPLMTAEERYAHRKAKAVKAMMDIYDAPASIGLSNRERMEIIFAAIAADGIPGVLALKDDE